MERLNPSVRLRLTPHLLKRELPLSTSTYSLHLHITAPIDYLTRTQIILRLPSFPRVVLLQRAHPSPAEGTFLGKSADCRPETVQSRRKRHARRDSAGSQTRIVLNRLPAVLGRADNPLQRSRAQEIECVRASARDAEDGLRGNSRFPQARRRTARRGDAVA